MKGVFFMIERVSVVGATGMLGKPVAEALRWHGTVVRVLGNDLVKGKAVYVKGPQALTMDQALRLYRDHVAPSLTITHIPLWSLNMLAAMSFNSPLQEIAKSMTLFGTHPEPGDSSECDRLLGPLTITLEQWCDARSAARVPLSQTRDTSASVRQDEPAGTTSIGA